jgi:subtilisin family serine protease
MKAAPYLSMRCLLLLSFFCGNFLYSEAFVPGEFLVKFKGKNKNHINIRSFGDRYGLQLQAKLSKQSGVYLFKRSVSALSTYANQRLAKALKSNPKILMAEENFVYSKQFGPRRPPTKPADPVDAKPVIPNDLMFSFLWGLQNIAQVDSEGQVGLKGADSFASFAWNHSTGSKKIIVAVVDSGINYLHPDLADNMWSHFVDGQLVHGFNAIRNESDPMDDNGHGTHVAGTIGAVSNNELGVAGMAWDVQLMALKFLRKDGTGRVSDAIKAVDWGVAHGADIMNHSYGGGGRSQFLADAFKRAQSAGVVMVAAAGNNLGNDNDVRPVYPASYEIESLLTVASTDNRDQLSDFSNIGPSSVDLAAPGENILSTWLEEGYETLSGTSMAAPHVSGAAALLLSRKPHLSPFDVRQLLIHSVDKKRQFSGKLLSEGRLNAQRLLKTDLQSIHQ